MNGAISHLGDGRLSVPGCLCPTGYETGIENLCVDIDECKDFKHDCDWRADCINTDASFECVCKYGFQGDGYNCTDIDECLSITDCSSQASCVNEEGFYNCECNSGFFGDGFGANGCSDIDECAAEIDVCFNENTYCMNTRGRESRNNSQFI